MRRSGLLMSRMYAVSEVDFPEPVGPVTKMMPCGVSSARVSLFALLVANPSSAIESGFDFWLSKRKETLSPYIVGMVEIRISSSFAPLPKEIRPSCGRRFSEIFNFAIIFSREMIAP